MATLILLLIGVGWLFKRFIGTFTGIIAVLFVIAMAIDAVKSVLFWIVLALVLLAVAAFEITKGRA